jgi:hypothetical protein
MSDARVDDANSDAPRGKALSTTGSEAQGERQSDANKGTIDVNLHSRHRHCVAFFG